MNPRIVLALALLVLAAAPRAADAQEYRVRDLTLADQDIPVRLVGYGLVVGLDGTGDRAMGGYGAGHTVRSVVNLLRNFNIEVPAEVLRTRNVAAVLVTAEASPYLRPGGRFQIQVASLGDATSLRGGVLWTTPLVGEVGGQPLATAQGPILISGEPDRRRAGAVETTARLPDGGLLIADLPRPDFQGTSRLLLREPDLGTASRIAEAINAAIGPGTAMVEDPGAIALALGDGARAETLTRISELSIAPDRRPQVVIDPRDGTVVAGGEIVVGEAVVSHGGMTLAIGGNGAAAVEPLENGLDDAFVPSAVRVEPGTSVQDIAAALHAVSAPPSAIAAIFESLRAVGAIAAEVRVR